jgi:WD40 repeat protein
VDVGSLAYSPDGKVLASGDRWGRNFQLWDAALRRLLYQVSTPGRTVAALAFSPDGTLLVTGAADSPVAMREVRTGRLVGSLQGSPSADAFAFSPDGKTLATNEFGEHLYRRAINLWRVPDGKHLRRIETYPHLATNLVFSTDGQTLFAGSGGAIAIYDVATGKPVGPARDAPATVRNLTLAPRSNALACFMDYQIQLHNLPTGRAAHLGLPTDQGFEALALSADGRQVASLCSNQLSLWDSAAGKLVQGLTPAALRSKQCARPWRFPPTAKRWRCCERMAWLNSGILGAGRGCASWISEATTGRSGP